MRMSLKSRRKFGFCDGSITKPTDKFLLDQWKVVQCTVVQWIMHSIDPSLKDSISYCEDAKLLWTDLQDQFSVIDGAKIQALKTQLHECRQSKGMSVTTYYGNLKVLWEALATHEPPFACKCGCCNCGIAKDALARQDSERLHKFLMGLDSSLYGTLRSNQLALDPLPSLSRAYNGVLQEERVRASSSVAVDLSDVMAYAVRREPSTSGAPDWRALREAERQERRKLHCTHCSASGHEAQSCFIKSQKFPDWWGDRPRTLEEMRSCTGSSSIRTPARANVLTAELRPTSSQDRLSGMSYEWIIDTGASRHVTGDVHWLTEMHSIPPYPVSLPNGYTVSATVAGTVHLTASLSLRDVLFIPS
ncbi:hypothetical protein RND81_07G030700 [Saponaria officinalis]|uniref:Retrovirus-related Pol polyprotein from transposon TNT 1-94-like beta-barrel domain-containing protein n=1 Tax=Saponaria officinalis TaxID=3572 RepID=A0AAW1JLA5_SAPOF